MGEQVRSADAERMYNKRWLVGALVGPLLLGLGAAAWMFFVADRLPPELATHWNGRNEVDGYSSLWGTAVMTVAVAAGTGALLSVLAVISRGQNLLIGRIGLGFGIGFAVGLTALMVAVVAGQLDLVDASQADMSGPVIGTGLALAFVAAAVVIWLYKPGEVDRTQSAEVLAANATAASTDSALAAAAQAKVARGETLRIKVSMGKWGWAFSLGLGGIVAVSTYFIFPVLALLGVVVAAITWIFCSGIMVIGPEGHTVLAGGFWKVMPLEWKEVRGASVEDITAMDYGGWGYRMNGGSVGFIMGSGPAIVMEAGYHQKFVVSMPDVATAGQAAALINAYVHAGKVQN